MITKKVTVFENIYGQWVASSNSYDFTTAPTKQEVINLFKLKNKGYRFIFKYD